MEFNDGKQITRKARVRWRTKNTDGSYNFEEAILTYTTERAEQQAEFTDIEEAFLALFPNVSRNDLMGMERLRNDM